MSNKKLTSLNEIYDTDGVHAQVILSSLESHERVASSPFRVPLPHPLSYPKSVLTEAAYHGLCWHKSTYYESVHFPEARYGIPNTVFGNLARINDIRRINNYLALLNVN